MPGRSRRVVTWASSRQGWAARVASVAVLLVVAMIALLLLIPALVIGVLVFLVLSVYVSVRTRFAAWRHRRGLSEGRENVRVIRRD